MKRRQLNIGVDIDDTVCDVVTGACEVAKAYCHGHLLPRFDRSAVDSYEHVFVGHDGEMSIYDAIVESLKDRRFALSRPPYEGAREVIGRLKEVGHNVIMVTARRPQLAEVTVEWVRAKLGPLPILHLPAGEKNYNFDVLIDDAPCNIEAFAATGRMAILFDQPWNQGVAAPNIGRVRSWWDIENLLED